MMAAQSNREARRQVADDVIDNSGQPEQLEPAVKALHQRYLGLAKASSTIAG
jgi:dephospho-CoA kinase